ncbi:MAG: peptide ABC transporter substrate-binding protein, partial [Oscillospiraceae bacterium]|nr:peptide ABC transporter substrate-binding protein [Oscillospiraceae bacterium]
MLKKHILQTTALALIAALILTGCASTAAEDDAAAAEETPAVVAEEPAAEDEAAPENEEASDDLITIRSYIGGTLNSLDPTLNSDGSSLRMIAYTYEGLYKESPDGQLVLGAASDVDISEDGLTWTFTIRDDAYWSNGDPVTAYDFEFSWKRLADPDTGADYAYMLLVSNIVNASEVVNDGADVDSLGIEALDDKTFVVHFTTPCNYFPNLVHQAFFAPINQSFFESQGDQFGLSIENTIFNGQYQLTDWEIGGTYLKLEKNPTYYAADEVTTDVLEYRVITDEAQLVMAWENGEIDEIELTGDNVELYKDDPAYVAA